MWDLSGPEVKPVSPALAGGLFTTEPPGRPLPVYFFKPVSLQHRFWLLWNYAWRWLGQFRTKLSSSHLVAGFSACSVVQSSTTWSLFLKALLIIIFFFLVFKPITVSKMLNVFLPLGFISRWFPTRCLFILQFIFSGEFLSTPSSSSQSWGLGFMFGMLFMQFLNFIPPIKENSRKAHFVCIYMELCFSFWSLWRKIWNLFF